MAIYMYTPTYFMDQAILEAQKALDLGEVPIGAVITCKNRIIAKGHNGVEQLIDVTAHAEMLALTSASGFLQRKYLHECTLYVTLEPCVMCAAALRWSQIAKVVYAAADPKAGFMRYGKELLHPKTKLEFGIREEKCRMMMQDFFKSKRHNGQNDK